MHVVHKMGSEHKNLAKKRLGYEINAHLFRHIAATYAAQELKMTPVELAALLGHRSPNTCMKYYEVTNPSLAAEKFDSSKKDNHKN